MEYVRFEAATSNEHGITMGIFGLANRLARTGALSDDDWAWWRAANDWYDAAYPDPATVVSGIFDKQRNPGAHCWFKESAVHLLDRVPGYLDLLDRYGVRWSEVRSAHPGRILYEDDVQIVVVPDVPSACEALANS